MRIWHILGIEPTTDTKKIKEAYSQKVKTAHPEENPGEFAMLRQAYGEAMNFAREKSCSSKVAVHAGTTFDEYHFDSQSEKDEVRRKFKPQQIKLEKEEPLQEEAAEEENKIDFDDLIVAYGTDIEEKARKVVDAIRMAGDAREIDESIKIAIENGLLLQNDFFHIMTRDVVNSNYNQWKLKRLRNSMEKIVNGTISYEWGKKCDYRQDRMELLVQEIDEKLEKRKKSERFEGLGCMIGIAILILSIFL